MIKITDLSFSFSLFIISIYAGIETRCTNKLYYHCYYLFVSELENRLTARLTCSSFPDQKYTDFKSEYFPTTLDL